jgi:ACS family pantothenate transporter-like MFS transporter
MQLWLKGDKSNSWSLYQVNNLPTAINGWNIVMILAASVYVDATGRRMTVVAINLVYVWLLASLLC